MPRHGSDPGSEACADRSLVPLSPVVSYEIYSPAFSAAGTLSGYAAQGFLHALLRLFLP